LSKGVDFSLSSSKHSCLDVFDELRRRLRRDALRQAQGDEGS
jgi:hypothetical protein